MAAYDYNTSSAYDLSMYETARKQKKQQPNLKVVEKKSAKRTLSAAFTPKALGSFAIVVTLISLMVYNQVCLNEITSDINRLKSEIVQLESENKKATSQLDAMVSLNTVAERARDELGMGRLDQYQTEYVRLYGEDKINISDAAPGASGPVEEAKLAFRGLFSRMLEYIG